jgi:hypothetical protein
MTLHRTASRALDTRSARAELSRPSCVFERPRSAADLPYEQESAASCSPTPLPPPAALPEVSGFRPPGFGLLRATDRAVPNGGCNSECPALALLSASRAPVSASYRSRRSAQAARPGCASILQATRRASRTFRSGSGWKWICRTVRGPTPHSARPPLTSMRISPLQERKLHTCPNGDVFTAKRAGPDRCVETHYAQE